MIIAKKILKKKIFFFLITKNRGNVYLRNIKCIDCLHRESYLTTGKNRDQDKCQNRYRKKTTQFNTSHYRFNNAVYFTLQLWVFFLLFFFGLFLFYKRNILFVVFANRIATSYLHIRACKTRDNIEVFTCLAFRLFDRLHSHPSR